MSAPYQTSRASWRGIDLTIRHCPAWLHIHCGPVHHLEIASDGRVPLPITRTGYRSHFLTGSQALAAYGDDPVAYVLAWLEAAANEPGSEADARQLALF